MIIPNDLKYYPNSGRFRKIKDPTSKVDYSGIPVKERSSFKNYMASYTINNTKNIKANQGLELIGIFFCIPTVGFLYPGRGVPGSRPSASCIPAVGFLDPVRRVPGGARCRV
eukprot:SAG22_NODE_6982_length_788_cov_1.349782_2_plen_112_part_00